MRKMCIGMMGFVILLTAFASLSAAATPEFFQSKALFDARISGLTKTAEYLIDFEGYATGQEIHGIVLIPTEAGVKLTSNLCHIEIWDFLSPTKFAFGFGANPPPSGCIYRGIPSGERAYYDIELPFVTGPSSEFGVYHAVSFNIMKWDPDPLIVGGHMQVDFDDGTSAGYDIGRIGTPTEEDPEFFGIIVLDAKITKIRWTEPFEDYGGGSEETGLDDIRVFTLLTGTDRAIFDDNFNGDTPEQTPALSPAGFPPGDSITSNCSDGGTPVVCAANEFWVEEALAYLPSRHLAVKKIVNTPRISFHPDLAEATGTVFTISWRSISVDLNNFVLFGLYTSGSGSPAAQVAYTQDGNIYSIAGDPPLAPYSASTSQFFSMVVDLSAGTYDLFIDGTKKVTGAGLNASNNSGSFTTGSLVLWENETGKKILVDDIRMFRGADSDGDGFPGGVFVDSDGDGVPDSADNCPFDYNPGQADGDVNPDGTPNPDGVGDLCDNCPTIYNPPCAECSSQPPASEYCPQPVVDPPPPLSPVLVRACFQFTDPTKEIVVRPTCARTVWELTPVVGEPDPLVSTGCVNGPAVGIPDDLVPVPGTYCTEPCNLLDRFLPDVLTAPPGGPITYEAKGIFTTLLQCPPGENIPYDPNDPENSSAENVCPKILMVSVESDPVQVTIGSSIIDVYPGTFPNLINLGSTGTTPVGIFGSPTFDVTKVDLSSISMAGVGVALNPSKKGQPKTYTASTKDLNGDGYLDMVVHFVTKSLKYSTTNNPAGIKSTDTTVALTGSCDGTSFSGIDSIKVVK